MADQVGSTSSTADLSSYTFTQAALGTLVTDRKYFVATLGVRFANSAIPEPSLSGGGLTWNKLPTTPFVNFGTNDRWGLTVWDCTPGTPDSSDLVVSYGSVFCLSQLIILLGYDDVDTGAGTRGILQVDDGEVASSTSVTCTLASGLTSPSIMVGFAGLHTNTGMDSNRSDLAEEQMDQTQDSTIHAAEEVPGSNNSIQWTWPASGNNAAGALAFEVAVNASTTRRYSLSLSGMG